MQQQASAWLDAARGWINKKRPSIHRFLVAALIAPLIVSVVPAAPVAQAATSTTTAPQDVTATANGTTLNVTWGAPAYGANAVIAYQVDYSTDGSSWTTSSSAIAPGTYSYGIPSLTSGTSYYVRVAAKMGSSTSPWAYPWTKLYGTVNPIRDGSNNIVYETGFGRAAAGNQAANVYANSSFTRVRYKMQYLSNSGATYNYVSTDFAKWVATNNNKYDNAVAYNTPAATISTLEVPDAANAQTPIQATASDLTIESSNQSLNAYAVTGRLQIWSNNISTTNGWSGGADGSTSYWDYNDSPGSTGINGYGAFQVHDITNARTVFAWNRPSNSYPDIGIGNSPTCGNTGNISWVYCGGTAGATNYITANRDAWKLETFINVPTKMGSFGLLLRLDTKQYASYPGSGSTWSDVSGNGRNATLQNSLTTASVSNGSFNISALNFNSASLPADSSYSTGKYATINSDFNVDFSTGISVGFYADFGSVNSYERIIDIGGGSAANNINVFRVGTSSDLMFEIYSGSTNLGGCKAIGGIDSGGTWAHWAFVANGTSCTIYKNGAPYAGTNFVFNTNTSTYSSTGTVAFTPLPPSNVARSNAWIGRSNWANSYFEGYIADLAIYNKPLSQGDITSLLADQKASTVYSNAATGECATRVANPSNVTVTTVANDCLIKFTAPSNTTTANKWIVPSNVSAARVLAIGGGGAGGAHVGAGGGAGGMIDTTVALSPTSVVPISTGAGGTNNGSDATVGAYRVGSGTSYIGQPGANTKFGSALIALGGGAGASWDVVAVRSGGSGGGATAYNGSGGTSAGTTLDSSQGNNGGYDIGTCGWTYGYPTGGGGGAGGPGQNGICSTYSAGKSGDGGVGRISDITGVATYYAGGGGGAGHNDGTYAIFQGSGGLGGGGNAALWKNGVTAPGACSNETVRGVQGTDGLGGGGGAAGIPASATCSGYAGRGGSGVVYVRYGTTTLSISANGGSGYTGTTSFTTSTYAYLTLPAQSGVTRSGYTFAGWNTSANGNGTNYAAGSLFQALGSQTLYAQWNSTISYNANGPTIARVIDTTTATGSGATTTLNNGAVLSNGMVTTGLDLYLDASNSRSYSGTGTTWYDLSGNNRNATAVGSPTFDSTNGAFTLNGTSQYFDLGNTNLNYQGTQPYTFGAWIKSTNATKTEQCLICRYNAGGSFLFRLIGGQVESYRVGQGSYQYGSLTLTSGTYYYLTTTYDGTNINIFINGTRVYSAASGSMSFTSTINTYIGKAVENYDRYFQGQMKVIQAYNIALTDGQVMQNYNALVNKSIEAKLPSTQGSKAGYTFTGWATTGDTAAAVTSGTYATGLNAVPTPYIRLKATDYDGTNWTPTNYNGVGISYLTSTKPTLRTNQTGWGTSATFSSIYGTSGNSIRLGNTQLDAYTFCVMAKWPVNGVALPASSGRMFTSTNTNWLDGWYYTNIGDTYHQGWAYDGSYNDYNWHYYCDTGNDIYLDGVKINSAYQSYVALPPMLIGGGYNGVEYVDYEFSELIIYDKVLSADQLAYVNRYFRTTYGFEGGAVDAPSASLIPSATFSSPGTSTVYATWGSTITYEGNGASSGTAPAVQIFQRSTGTLATNSGNLSIKGMSFTGWNTKADGTGTFYAAGASYSGPDVTLYAMFKAPVKITGSVSGTDPITLAPYMRFKASDYNATSKIWYDSSGNGRDTSYIKGSPTVVTTTVGSNGASKAFQTLVGATNATGASPDGVRFKNPTFSDSQWTVFSVARLTTAQYSTGARLFDGESGNQLFGFYANSSGAMHSGNWITGTGGWTQASANNIFDQNWVISTGQTDYYKGFGLNKAGTAGTSVLGTGDGSTNTFSPLTINAGEYVGTDYSSGWAVAEVIMFDRKLSATEMKQVQDYLASTYGIQGYSTQNSYLDPATVNAAANSITISDSYTAVLGYNNTFALSPSIPGISLNIGTNSASLTVASTVAVGTYYETITATDYNGNTASVPIQISVVNPIVWSGSNPSTVATTLGKTTRTRLDLSGGYGTRVALISHSSTPASRGVSIDTSTIASGYITLITDTGTAPGTYIESITVTDGSRIVRTLLMTITVNAPPNVSYTSATDSPYPYRTSNLVLNVDPSNLNSYSGSGQTIRDISPTGKTFTFYTSSDVVTSGIIDEASGGSISQTNNNLYAQTTSLPSMDTFTVETWANWKGTNSTDEWRAIVSDMYTTGGDKINFFVGTCGAASNQICGLFYDGSAWQAKVSFIATPNTWYHITYVVGGTTGSHTGYLYVNGVLVATSSTTTSNPSTSNRGLRIGRRHDSANIFTGLIGSVRIYNTALSATQIAQNYANTKPRFASLSAAAPTISGNAVVTTTEGKATTYQVFAETGGTGTNTFSLSGANSTFSLASVGTDQTSLVVGSATTATNSTTAKTYYETLTATDSTTAATAYYVTVNVNPKITITAATDTVTTTYYTYGKIAYDTITAAYGTGTLTYSRVSSSNSSAITTSVTGNQLLLGVTWNLPVGTYYETFTVTDSVGATSVKVIAIIVNPQMSVVSATGSTTLTTTYSVPTSLRVNISGGTGTKVISMYKTSLTPWKLTVDTSTQASNYVTFRVDSYTAVGSHSINIGFTDAYGAYAVIGVTVNVNPYPQINGIANDKSYVTTGLVVNLDAGDPNSYPGTGTTWKDLSGPAGNFTFQGTPTYSAADGGSIRTSSGNWVQSNDTYSLLTNMTIEATFKVNAFSTNTSSNRCVVTTYDGGTAPNFGLCFVGTSAKIRGAYWSASAWRGVSTATTDLALNTWYHAVYSVSCFPGQFCLGTLYLNGVSQGTSTSEANFPVKNDPNRIIVGKRYNDNVANDQFDGWIQTIRIYDNTIGADAITQNYTASLARTRQSNAITVVTTQGGSVNSPDLVVSGGTGTTLFYSNPGQTGIDLTSGIVANSAMYTSQTTLAAQDSQTAKSYIETLTATDQLGAQVKFKVTYLVNPPIIETATVTTLTTTSGIETSTVIYATKGTGDKTFTLTGDASSGVTLVSGTNQATLRVLSTINPGTYWETITASDTSAATTSIAVKVIVNSVPTIVGRTTITSTTSTAYKSLGYYVANGTGSLKLTMSPTISGITLDTSTAGVAYIRLANTLTTESTNYETLTVTDANGAVGRLVVMIKIVAPVSLTGNKTVVSTFGDSNLFSYTATGGTSPYNIAITGQQSTCITSKSIDGSSTVEQFLGGMKPGTSCTWVVPNGVTSLTGLVIAGGGQGGTGRAGGGGAGTMIEGSMTVAAGDVLTVTVGAGGSNAACASANSPAGCDGIDSIIGVAGNTTYIVAKGGGGGGGHLNNYSGRTGGSGGGAGMNYASVVPVGGTKSGSNIAPAGWTAFSNDGAATADTEVTPNNYRNTGGGGGAGSTGFPGSCTGASPACNNSGTGGGARPDGGNARANSITGTSTMYAGGGGGSVAIATSEVNGSYKSAIAGNDYSNYLTDKGGAGKGASPTRSVGTDAAANTGSGGGGSITDSGGYGASGIVVFRYLTPTAAPANNRISFSLISASTGQFNMTVPESITVGTYLETVTVSSSNDASNIQTTAVITVVVIQDTPTATVSLPGSVLTAKYGTPVTLTAATSTNGRVNFKKAGASISGCGNVATSNGLATCTWVPTAVESTVISALLTPSDSVNYRTSIETDTAITVVVGKADTLTITANTPTAITYSASMTMPANGFTTSGLKSTDSITALTYSYMTSLGSTCATGGICSVGDRGPAGGIVFYVSPTIINVASGISTGGIYLEAAPSSSLTTYNWCNNTNYSVYSNGINIGQGADNTRLNAAACTSGASYQAANLTQAGYSDWFLPSNYELVEMTKMYAQIGMDTSSAFYWSSTEYTSQIGYGLYVLNGVAAGSWKYSSNAIWPIRAFGGENLISGAPTNAGTYSIVPNSATFNPGAESNYVSVQYKAGTLVINKAPRGTWSTTYNAGSNSTRYGVGKTETATVTYPGDGVKAFSTASSTCSVDTSTGTLTTLGVGACDVQTVLPATRNWLSDTKTVTVTINRGLRTATVTPVLTTIKYGDTTTVTSTISPALDSATVTYSNNGTLGCAVDNVTGEVTGIKALAACTVRVTFDRTTLYESATATASITVNKAVAPVVTTDSITAIAYTGATAIVTPTYSVTGILARDISQILPLADVSTTAAISAIAANTYSTVASYRYRETSPTTSYDSTTAPSLGGTYSVTPQTLTLLSGLDIGNYETPTYVSRNLVITPIAQAPLIINLSYLESITVPYDVVTSGGSSTGARTLSIQTGGTATGCAVDTGVSSMRLKSSAAGTCVIRVTQAADRNYLAVTSDSQTVNILNFVVNILQLFDNPTGIAINHEVPFTTGDIACTSNCVPTITRITDANGVDITTMKTGTSFRIIGTNFNTAVGVFFTATIGGSRQSGVSADSFQIDSDTQITVMPPTSFVPNAGESISAIVVRIYVRASGGQNFPNTMIVAISL